MSLVQASQDPKVYAYVVQNLGKVVQHDGTHTACGYTASQLLGGLSKALFPPPAPPRHPLTPRNLNPAAGTDRTSHFTDYRTMIPKMPTPPLGPTPLLVNWFMPFDFDWEPPRKAEPNLLPRDPVELKKLIDGPVRDLLRAKLDDLRPKLKDPQPLTRWLTVQVISQKHVHLEGELIGLLRDPNRQVREAVHVALVRLARGTDFGPTRHATPAQLAEAIQSWRGWLAIQRPYVAPTAESPLREGIPRPREDVN